MPVTLGTGQPFAAAIINTDPKELRFIQKFNKAYEIRIEYIPLPPEITTMTQEFYSPVQFNQLRYLKFVEIVARDMGEDSLANTFAVLYEIQLRKDRNLAAAEHITNQGMEFSYFA